ncbi:MAG TPA: VOC family protein [Candidatus Binatia bacterium]|nr:VOC family protein [Candidatus Binatia bacterium]
MLGNQTVVATVAVKDIEKAKNFYEGTLGLTRADADDPGGVLYKSGDSHLFVYASKYAGTNQATAASWGVGEDIDSVVKELEGKGVNFETYDMPNTTREGAIHIMGELKTAWFKDPDGNILNIVNKM